MRGLRIASLAFCTLAAVAPAQGPQWTANEAAWLATQGNVVHVVVTGGRPPIEFFDGDQARGIVADYLALLSEHAGISFVAQPASAEGAPGIAEPMVRSRLGERKGEDGWVATNPYLRLPVVIVAREGAAEIERLDDLAGRRIGAQMGNGPAEVLLSRLPALSLARLPTASDALQSLARGDLDAVVMELPCVFYAMRAEGLRGLRIAGPAGFTVPCAFWVHADSTVLPGLLTKAIAQVPEGERDRMFARWMQGERTSSWVWALWVLASVGVALIGTIAWNRTLARRVSARTAELALERAKREQSERLATLGTLMASVAHEVNNPNHAIMLNTPVLRHAWQDALVILDEHAARNPGLKLANVAFHEMRDDLARMVDEIQRSAVRIRDIVAAMRGYARDRSRHEYSNFDLVAAVRAAVAGREGLIAASCRAFSLDMPAAPVPVLGNRLQLEQVVAQLVSNACEGLSDASQPIVVTLRVDAPPGVAVLDVRDCGRGIPRDRLEDIVRPFSAARGHGEGIGLGLPMSAWIVQQHRGKLAIESEVGSGTRVTVTIPIVA